MLASQRNLHGAHDRGRIGQTPDAFGSRAHLYFRRLNDRLNARLEQEGSEYRILSEYSRNPRGLRTRYGTPKSIRVDAALMHTGFEDPLQIFDLKTHGGREPPFRSVGSLKSLEDMAFSPRRFTTSDEVYSILSVGARGFWTSSLSTRFFLGPLTALCFPSMRVQRSGAHRVGVDPHAWRPVRRGALAHFAEDRSTVRRYFSARARHPDRPLLLPESL